MILVTGGAGFIGRALVAALDEAGEDFRILDNFYRGERGHDRGHQVMQGDIRDLGHVLQAADGCDEIIHLAYINGTKLFYEQPALVLDVAVRGMVNLLSACRHCQIKKFLLVSSSEVCRADVGGMDEAVPLVIPDPFNPRYSYSAGKIISEMLAIHSGLFDRLLIVRPFNIYGRDMSPGHVIPDFAQQLREKILNFGFNHQIPFTIMGSGDETRAFCYIDDFIEGLLVVRDRGIHNGVYNIGTSEEVTIRSLARQMGLIMGFDLNITDQNLLPEGSIQRRRPEIDKLTKLGFAPKVSLSDGLRRVLC